MLRKDENLFQVVTRILRYFFFLNYFSKDYLLGDLLEDVGEVGDKVVVEHLLVGAAVVLADRVNQVHQREHLVCWHLKSYKSNKETNKQTNNQVHQGRHLVCRQLEKQFASGLHALLKFQHHKMSLKNNIRTSD